ncbi:MAG: WD40/YVTN/BNR-like repeat-containing protein [Promethearchaeota archaeon]
MVRSRMGFSNLKRPKLSQGYTGLIIIAILSGIYLPSNSGQISMKRGVALSLGALSEWALITNNYIHPDTWFRDVVFVNATHGWIVGENGTLSRGGIILHTIDGGQTWNLQFYEKIQTFRRISIVNTSTIWVAGLGSLYYSYNGGQTWNQSVIADEPSGLGVSFLNETHGWTGTGHTLYRTIDAGQTWQEDLAWTFEDTPRKVIFSTPMIGYIGGFFGVYKTNDGGVTWYQQYQDDIFLGSIYIISETEGWLVGDNTLAHMTDGETWKRMPIPYDPETFHRVPYFHDVQFVTSDQGWIAGVYPPLMHTQDGGRSWYAQTMPGKVSGLSSLFFLNTTHGWAVGHDGLIILTVSGGGTGTKLVTPSSLIEPVYFLLGLTLLGLVAIIIVVISYKRFDR